MIYYDYMQVRKIVWALGSGFVSWVFTGQYVMVIFKSAMIH